MPTAVEDAINALKSDPETFLRMFRVSIAGGSTRPAGRTVFKMELSQDDMGNLWRIGISPSPDAANPDPVQGEFEAYYVPMLQMNNMGHSTLPAAGALDYMITSQLSGCTFGYVNQGGSTLVTHVKPPTGVSPASAGLNASVSGLLGHGAKIMGSGAGYAKYATVVGKRINGAWAFYRQSQGTMAGKSGKVLGPVSSF